MLSILRSDLYRLTRQPGTYIILAVLGLIMGFNSFSLGLFLGDAGWLQNLYSQLLGSLQDSVYSQELFSSFALLFGLSSDSVLEFVSLNMKGDLLYFMAAFAATFIAQPKSTGFLKNTAPNYDRRLFFYSHLAVLFFYSFVMMLVTVFANFLAAVVFFENTPLGNVSDFLLYLVLTWLLVFTSGVLMTVVIGLFRRSSTGVLLIFGYLILGSGIVYTVLDLIASSLLNRDVTMELFTPAGALSVLEYGNSQSMLVSLIVVGIYLFLAVFYESTLGWKKDL